MYCEECGLPLKLVKAFKGKTGYVRAFKRYTCENNHLTTHTNNESFYEEQDKELYEKSRQEKTNGNHNH